jgi:hypothetical protein
LAAPSRIDDSFDEQRARGAKSGLNRRTDFGWLCAAKAVGSAGFAQSDKIDRRRIIVCFRQACMNSTSHSW